MPPPPSRCLQTYSGHEGPVYAVALDKNGEYCLSGGRDKRIRLWNTASTSSACVQEYEGAAWDVYSICISPALNTFASGGGDRAVLLWDVAQCHVVRKLGQHFERVNSVAFSGDGQVLASGSYDRKTRLWDIRAGAAGARFPIMVLEEAKDSVTDVRILDKEIATASVDGCVRVYDVRNSKLVTDCVGRPATSVCFTGDGHCVLVSALDSTVRLVDKADGRVLNGFVGHRNETYKISSVFSYDDVYVLSGSEDGCVLVWDLVEACVVKRLVGHKASVTSLVYHPKKHSFVCAGLDGAVKLFG